MKLNPGLLFCILFFLSVFPAYGAGETEAESDQQIDDFSLAGYGEKGKKSWDLSGKSADVFTDVVKLKDVDGNLYGKEENINLTAKTGDFNKSDGKVHLEKDVVITTSGGARLTTDSMNWDRKSEQVTTEDRVNIAKDNMTITATGAHGEPNLKKIALKKDVRVNINPALAPAGAAEADLKDKITITCEGALEIDYEKNIATFLDNVKVERPDTIIFSDKMSLYFSSGKGNKKQPNKELGVMGNSSIDKIVCQGNVRIVRGENISYSEEAVYTAADKKIILSGRPKLIFYSTKDLSDASFGN